MPAELSVPQNALGINVASSNLTIAHIVFSLEVGGLERVIIDLIRQGSAIGQKSLVICLERRGILASDAEAVGAQVICLEKAPGIRLGLARKLAAILKQIQPHIVHTHQIGALFYAGRAAKMAKVPVVVHTEHGKQYSRKFKMRLLGGFSARYADCFFCVSNDIADDVRRYRIVHESKIFIAFNGVNAAQFECARNPAIAANLGIPDGSLVIGTVGRLTEIKRQDVLIRAFAKLHKSKEFLHLLIVGDGSQRTYLERLSHDLNVDGFVHFAGYQSEPENFLALMDIFVLTSRSEGMPLAVLEAWAAGLPVIASNVGGLLEMIRGTNAGALFTSGNVEELKSKLMEFIVDEKMRKEFGQRGRGIIHESYSVEQMADRYHQHYSRLLGALRN